VADFLSDGLILQFQATSYNQW